MPKNTHTQRRRKLHLGRLFMCIVSIICLCAGTLYSIHTYNQPKLYGKWQSEETKKIVEFKKDGTVILENSQHTPTFTILSPNKMSYTIDQKVFEMYYQLKGRKLEWGIEKENVEVFRRK